MFAVGEAVADVGDVSANTGTSAWRTPVVINRIALYIAGLLAIGSVLYGVWMAPTGAAKSTLKHQGTVASVVAAVALLLTVPLGGAEMIDGGPTAPLAADAWKTAFGSTLGPSLLIGLPGAILLIVGFRRHDDVRSAMLWIGAALLAGSYLVTGHAATAAPVWLMATMVAVHLICGGFWFAGLRPLRRAVASSDIKEGGEAATRFSGIAVWTVAALFLSGAVMTWVQVQTPSAMFDNPYGVRLAIKIGLFLLVLAIAAYNKLRLTPRLAQSDASASPGLRRTIGIEYVLIVAIAVMAALLTLPTPPRALAAGSGAGSDTAASQAQSLTLTKGDYTAEVEVTPAKPGPNMVMVEVKDAAGNAIELIDFSVEFGLPAASITGVTESGEVLSPGRYHLNFDQLVIPGEWSIQVNAFVSDFDKVIFRGTVVIR